MRPGPPRGDTASLEVVVTEEMTARVGGREVHAVYGTVALTAHVEQVCRELLVPHLEPGEDALGERIELLHRAPVPVGATVDIVATVATVGPTTMTCEILVRSGGAIVARGSFEQRVVILEDFLATVEARRA